MRVDFGEIEVRGTLPGAGDGLPILDAGGAKSVPASDLLRLGGGAVPRYPTVLPYDRQAGYSRDVGAHRLRVATVGDERTTATFLLDLGGRLWSLVVDGRELLYQSDPLMIGHLALRNAWFAGGTEWNLGFTGHWPLTCSPVFAGVVATPQGEVLRLWEYERMLGLVWRIDVAVRDGVLLVHPVLHNATSRTVPVYWWSNTAVPLYPDSRVIVPASDAWFYDEQSLLEVVAVPGDPDASRPARHPRAADHFFRLSGRPWMMAVDGAGTGLGQASTDRLPGRKLFRWGEGAGGRHWQRWLAPEGRGYLEIQAGLATTQLEHLPLPAGETWEWTEAYGAVSPGAPAQGDWHTAVDAGRAAIDAMIDPHRLEREHTDFAAIRDHQPTVVATGSGWGALQVAAGSRLGAGTPFPEDTLGPDQRPWLDLATGAGLPDAGDVPSAVTGDPWRSLLAAHEGWRERYLRALIAIADGDTGTAVPLLRASLAEHPSWQALRALAVLSPEPERGDLLLLACRTRPSAPLVIETLQALYEAGRGGDMLTLLDDLDPSLRHLPRVRLAEARAAVLLGDAARAGAILDDGRLEVPDLREGEDSLASLWDDYQGVSGGSAPLPGAYDFRMH
ncbi:MAG TPA: DUF5107 domain-containing protein [Propionibacteriaceae bacterium]|nr:DUF5107 domain-containing protein [Propionibacteriaceae bacterium]